MTSSPGFGSYARDKRAVHTRFPFGSGAFPLSHAAVRKLAGSFFNRHAVEVRRPLRLIVDAWFQIYFTALTGLLFTFPSRYWFTIDLRRYLALPVSTGGFIQAIRVSDYSRSMTRERTTISDTGLLPSGAALPSAFSYSVRLKLSFHKWNIIALQPRSPLRDIGLGYSRFARRYLGNSRIPLPAPKSIGSESEMSCWFLFLRVLRCFTSPGVLLRHASKICELLAGVSPFGHSRIEACLSAPRDFSQTGCVLHRSTKSRHPPYTLQTSARKPENHITFSHYAQCSRCDGLSKDVVREDEKSRFRAASEVQD